MKTNQAFWDSSALTLLCCNQPSTPIARKFARQYRKIIVWWETSVELCSAIARLTDQGILNGVASVQANQTLATLRLSWSEIIPEMKVRDLAETFPENYGLRAMDALQLAAALIWCKEKPRHHVFVCFDIRLAAAAEKAGFTVYPEP